jgi:hypothetical protein
MSSGKPEKRSSHTRINLILQAIVVLFMLLCPQTPNREGNTNAKLSNINYITMLDRAI